MPKSRLPTLAKASKAHDPTGVPADQSVLRVAEEAIGETLRRQKAEKAVRELKLDTDLREKFISLLSHDLRNPLTTVKASAELIARNPADPQRCRRFAEIIIDAAERADKMVRDLLDESRLRAGEKLPVYLSRCDLNEVVTRLLRSFPDAQIKRIVVKGEPHIVGEWDEDALRRAIENLLTNAVKYGADDRPITILLKREGRKALIAVHNEGNEICPEEQRELFQWFSRTSSAHSARTGGWGLGLMVVKGIAEAHGGQVRVESGCGGGTTFTIEIPQ